MENKRKLIRYPESDDNIKADKLQQLGDYLIQLKQNKFRKEKTNENSKNNHLNHSQHDITWVQAYSFMLFTLIYTPCLSTIATIRSEARNRAFSALAVAWPLALAWLVSFAFYQTASYL